MEPHYQPKSSPIHLKMSRARSARPIHGGKGHVPKVAGPPKGSAKGMNTGPYWLARSVMKDQAAAEQADISSKASVLKSGGKVSDLDLVSDALDTLHKNTMQLLQGGNQP